MKRSTCLLAIPLVLLIGSSVTVAQTTTATTKGAPEAGANSFTEAQAKVRIEKTGFSQVSGLETQLRRGAKKGESQVNVSLDFRGNVTTQ